ncbi:hypothetical protein HGRIS_003468 [Hohenbuehelia grisea]|uniref:High nitrogen upregulated cytochrome P450 monooxygenase 2 n=1 Tax=Hohenbuehelia grisea TaxID=104357 RepID=A0ABR3JG13_9AGAR
MSSLQLLPIAGGLLCHAVFKRFEPNHPSLLFVAFIVAPVALTISNSFAMNAPLTILSVASFWAVYISTILLSISTYRLSPFHPLAQYPGPVICKLTKLWPAYISWTGKQHLYYDSLHRTYGDVVRIGPNELSIRKSSAISPLLGQNELPKGPMWDGRLAEGGIIRSMIGVRDVSEHSRRRRPWSRAFSISALKHYEAMIVRRAYQLKSRLEEQKGTIDLSAWMGYFAYDFMSDMAFGGGSEMMRDGDEGGFWHLLDDVVPFLTVLGHLPWLTKMVTYVPVGAAGRQRFRALAIGCAKKRISEGSMSKDIFYYLNNEDGHDAAPRSFAEVLSDGGLAIIAGSDTTATTLTSIFGMLLSNPDAHKRLLDEIDAHFPVGEDIMNPAVHARMPYLNAVINEALRMFPPVPTNVQRANPQDAPARVTGSVVIPAGTSVITPPYALHRDPQNFSEPEVFIPERWLDPELQEKLGFSSKGMPSFIHDSNAFIPFSYGPSNCAGKALAYQEMRMVLCLLVRSFDMKLVSSVTEWVDSLEDYFLLSKKPLMVEVSPRAESVG